MIKHIILLLVICITACNTKEEKVKLEKKADNEITAKKIEKKTNDEEIKVRNFLKWYKNNMKRLNLFNTIEGGMSTSENETPKNYSVNFDETEKYFTELKKSEFFTEQFLGREKQTYIEGDIYFKENPENDGPPTGFDYDHFFLTQDEFELDLENADKINFTTKSIDSTNSEVQFDLPICGMKYKYSLKKEKSNWLIDKIENMSIQR